MQAESVNDTYLADSCGTKKIKNGFIMESDDSERQRKLEAGKEKVETKA